MFDPNWELIDGEAAHAIEVLNQASVANFIEAMVRYLQHHDSSPGHDCALCPDEMVLKELHRTGTLLLLSRPGEYRLADVHVQKGDGGRFDPPETEKVPALMSAFAADLEARWPAMDAVEVASWVLWRINWIHPFKNGNGRTARAFAYTCVCLKAGFMLPGSVTLIDLITNNRETYEAALGHADQAFAATGEPDLGPMQQYVHALLTRQLSSVPGLTEAPKMAD